MNVKKYIGLALGSAVLLYSVGCKPGPTVHQQVIGNGTIYNGVECEEHCSPAGLEAKTEGTRDNQGNLIILVPVWKDASEH
jgi:hypothetical protein